MTHIDQRVDELVKEWRESGTTNPVLNRLLHTSEAQVLADIEGDLRAEQFLREQRHDCHCYPRGFVSTPRAVKEEMKAEHIKAGVHEGFCPLWVDKTPLYSRSGDAMAPSYTIRQQHQDEDAERVDYGAGARRFRQAD